MNPKVSIVIPCYGVEKYISNIFDDLKKQNFKDNMEFIFVNDGGSNTLEDIIVDFAKKDSRVLLISKKNGGGYLLQEIKVQMQQEVNGLCLLIQMTD